MKLKIFIPYFLSLFLGFNILNAQNREEESLKTYIMDEFVVDQEKTKEEKLKEEGFEKAIYFGSSVKEEISKNADIQTPASNLISKFFFQGVPADILTGFYIGNIPIIGNPWQQQGVSTFLGSRLLSKINISSEGYSARYDALLGVVRTEPRNFVKKDFGFEISSNLLERYLLVNFPLSMINGNLAFYIDNKEPFGFLEKTFPELRFLNTAKSYQIYLQALDGKINIISLNFLEDNDVTDDELLDDKTFRSDKESRHNLVILNLNHEIFNYKSNLNLGHEYWNDNLNQFIDDDEIKNDFGTKAYTLNAEIKDNSGFNALGATFYSIKNNGLNDLNNPEIKDESVSKNINALKVYYDNKTFVTLFPKKLLMETSVGLNKFRNKYAFSFGLNSTYDFGKIQTSLGYAHKANSLEKNNPERAFKKEEITRTQVAEHYLASISFDFDNDLIDDFVVHFYYKEYNATSGNEELDGYTKGFTTSLKKDARFSYNLRLSILNSKVNNHHYLGSIDKTINLSNSFKVNDWLTLFSNLSSQDGHWSNRSFSQNYRKLGNSFFADIGVSVNPSLFKKNDLRISLGGYNLFGDNPIYDFENRTVNAPRTGTLDLTFTY